MGDRYVFQAGIKVLTEDRNSGQVSHGKTSLADPYKISIGTDRYEAFTKNAYIFNKEKNTNLALILSGSCTSRMPCTDGKSTMWTSTTLMPPCCSRRN